jgi:hypothetical protein
MILAPFHGMTGHRFPRRIALPFALLCASTLPAHADFYRLEGRFQCLDQPDTVCYDAAPTHVEAPPDATAPLRESPPEPAPVVAIAPAKPVQPADPITLIAARIKAERPDAGDVAALRRAAKTGDPRAIELLAWCALRGIGTDRDPVEAYLLYGAAAAESVPRARENQALIYEETLTGEERQRVLDREATGRLALRASDPDDSEEATHHVR